MATMISPGVYTNIIDLSQYLEEVPGTVAFMPFLSRRGPDNKLTYTTTQQDFAERYGEPKLSDYGKAYGQGPYIVWNHLAVSSNFYTLRCLPDDAQYAHLMVGMQLVETPVDKEKTDIVRRLALTPIYFDGHKDKYTPSGYGFVGKIKTVDADGRITSIEIEQEGRGYEQDALSIVPSLTTGEGFQATITEVDNSGSIEEIRVDDCGMNYIERAVPVNAKGSGAEAKLNILDGVIKEIPVTNGGSGYDATDTVSIVDEDQIGTGNVDADISLVLADGVITGIEVTAAGEDYSSGTVTLVQESNASATASITVEEGEITGIVLGQVGSGYTAGTVTITQDDNTTATATVTVANGYINGLQINNGGTGYTLGSTSRIVIRDSNGVVKNNGAEFDLPNAVIARGVIDSVTLVNGGQQYNKPAVAISTTTGSGAAFVTKVADPGYVTDLVITSTGSDYKPFNDPSSTVELDGSTSDGEGLRLSYEVADGSIYKVSILDGGTGYTVGEDVTIVQTTKYRNGIATLVQGENETAQVTITTAEDVNGDVSITAIQFPPDTDLKKYRGIGYRAGDAIVEQNGNKTAVVTIGEVTSSGAISGLPVIKTKGNNYSNNSAVITIGAVNDSIGAIVGVAITNGGSGYKKSDKLNFVDNASSGTFVPTVKNGVVRRVNVINGGSGYDPETTFVVLSTSNESAWTEKPRFTANVNEFGQLVSVDIVDRGSGINEDVVYPIVKGTGIGAEVELVIVDGAITALSASDTTNYREGNSILIDDVPEGTGAVLIPKVMNGHITDVVISDKDQSTGYIQGTYLAARLSQRDVNYPTINHVKELRQFFSDAYQSITHRYMSESTTGGTGVDYGFLMYFRAVGRGDYYNGLSITLTRNPNPNHFGEYEFAVYEEEEDGDTTQVENFHVSFDPNATDTDGDSMFIEDVINRFSKRIICQVSREALETLDRYKDDFYRGYEGLPSWVAEIYPSRKSEGIEDGYKQKIVELARADVEEAEAQLETALSHLAEARALPSSTSIEIIERNNELSIAISEVSQARTDLNTAKQVLADAEQADIMDFYDIDAETDLSLPIPLKEGSEGSLTYLDKNTGRRIVDEHTANMVLADGYLGLLTKPDNEPKSDGTYPMRSYCDEMLDLDWIYFSIVYEAYPLDVKYAAMELVTTYRRDCMLFSDCGDNIDYDDLMSFKGLDWSSRYVARYEGYSKIYDAINGNDIWISPIYHMAQIIPMNDLTTAVWFAPAGFNRATINTIKELRWSPKQGERDMLTMAQVNPIVHFPQGYTVWGQKTTQKRPSALQDVNCMRLVLYIKRALENYCKYYIFELNDDQTHEMIRQEVSDFLAEIQSKRGLTDYSVDVGCTDYEFKNKICHVNVSLTPMRIIEKIELNLYIY